MYSSDDPYTIPIPNPKWSCTTHFLINTPFSLTIYRFSEFVGFFVFFGLIGYNLVCYLSIYGASLCSVPLKRDEGVWIREEHFLGNVWWSLCISALCFKYDIFQIRVIYFIQFSWTVLLPHLSFDGLNLPNSHFTCGWI